MAQDQGQTRGQQAGNQDHERELDRAVPVPDLEGLHHASVKLRGPERKEMIGKMRGKEQHDDGDGQTAVKSSEEGRGDTRSMARSLLRAVCDMSSDGSP